MARRRKVSKCPEPINTLLDIAGAAALGIYVKHRVKKDFENGQGEESAKAAAIVFGRGAMRRGSQGMYNLGGLLGLNSALKDMERKQMPQYIHDSHVYISPIEQVPSTIVKPVPSGVWRDYCEDGSQYGIDPDEFDTADDYADALRMAKEMKDTGPATNGTVSISDREDAQLNKNYRWRKYCADGSQYGISPDDYETADDYEDALMKAKEKSSSSKKNNG